MIVRDVNLTSEDPKICNAIMGETQEDIVQETKILSDLGADLFEWRADYYTDIDSPEAMTSTLARLRKAAKDHPIIFSIQSMESGAPRNLSLEQRSQLCQQAILSGAIDLVELELTLEEKLPPLLALAQEKRVKTILSYYNYQETPPQEQIVQALCRCESFQPDVSKIAVTTKTKSDTIRLLLAMTEVENLQGERPRIVVGMGPKGNISRILPSFFGSVITYACGITTSLAGQINASDLRMILSYVR